MKATGGRTKSLPSWECGLKYQTGNRRYFDSIVTPFVGVWIEIILRLMQHVKQWVTPFVGVWIEINTACGGCRR
mgnify:FL=1